MTEPPLLNISLRAALGIAQSRIVPSSPHVTAALETGENEMRLTGPLPDQPWNDARTSTMPAMVFESDALRSALAGGLAVVVSPYTWMEEHTPKSTVRARRSHASQHPRAGRPTSLTQRQLRLAPI